MSETLGLREEGASSIKNPSKTREGIAAAVMLGMAAIPSGAEAQEVDSAKSATDAAVNQIIIFGGYELSQSSKARFGGPTVPGPLFSGKEKLGGSPEIGARYTRWLPGELLGGQVGLAGEVSYTKNKGSFTPSTAFPVSISRGKENIKGLIGLIIKWEVPMGFNPYVGGLVGGDYSKGSVAVTNSAGDDLFHARDKNIGFSWKALVGAEIPLGESPFSVNIEAYVKNNPGSKIKGPGGISYRKKESIGTGFSVGAAYKF